MCSVIQKRESSRSAELSEFGGNSHVSPFRLNYTQFGGDAGQKRVRVDSSEAEICDDLRIELIEAMAVRFKSITWRLPAIIASRHEPR